MSGRKMLFSGHEKIETELPPGQGRVMVVQNLKIGDFLPFRQISVTWNSRHSQLGPFPFHISVVSAGAR